jgi:rod shape-determining protein MreD
LSTTLFIALFLNYIPTGHLPAVPDFVALVLAFWCVREPLKIGIGAGFVFGLLTDIGVGAAMGQHAFLRAAGLCGQRAVAPGAVVHAGRAGLHVLPLLFMSQVVMVVVRLLAGPSSGLVDVLRQLRGALLWIPLHYVLLLPQYQPVERDENRPI